jgi:hypothetical protein
MKKKLNIRKTELAYLTWIRAVIHSKGKMETINVVDEE